MRRSACAGALVLAALAGACGPRPPDLFVIDRSGSVPGARLHLTVADNGIVHCNGGLPRRLPSPLLLSARQLARDLGAPAARRLRLPPGPGSVLSYRVRLAAGVVSFSDNSVGQPPALRRIQGFTRAAAKQACGLAR